MKSTVVILSFAASILAGSVLAQDLEKDDMYFNSKDRAKLHSQKNTESSYVSNYPNFKKKVDAMTDENDLINPTDSYSARNINPEFTSRANSQLAGEESQDYFASNYQYQAASNLNQFNNSYNNWYNNPWYSNSYFAPSMYTGWNNGYWGGAYNGYYYDTWNNPWYSPYYQSGLTMSYYAGSSGCSGWGFSYTWGNNPYYGINYGSYWGSPWGYNNNIIIINDGPNRVNYGKRPSHTSAGVTNAEDYTRTRRNASNTYSSTPTRNTTGGRTADYTSGRRSRSTTDSYYVRPMRRSLESFNTSTPSRTNTNYNHSNNNYNSLTSPSRERSANFDSSPSRSSSTGSFGGGSRSSSGGSSSGSSGGSRRGH